MADGVEVDASELYRLAADLESVAKNIGPFLTAALHGTSKLIKKSAQAKVRRRHKRFRGSARAIDYDLTRFRGFGASVIESEIGYDKQKGGALGSIIEFGAPGVANAVSPGSELAQALREEEADFLRGIERAVEDSMRGAGL